MITRHNYEELFLLYLDNELSPAERQSVEVFVKENPDLVEEMSALQQCRLTPDDEVSFGNLEPLLKDNRDRFIVPLRFNTMTRVAAAAILLLLTGLGVFIAMKKNTAAPFGKTINPAVAGTASPAVTNKNGHAIVTSATPGALYPATTDTQAVAVKADKQVPSEAGRKDHFPITQKDAAAPDDPIPDGQNPDDRAREQELTGTKLPIRQEVAIIDPIHTSLPERIFVEEGNIGGSTSYVTQAVQQDPVASSGDDFSEPAPAEKNKLRGIFRKVSRVFEKTANRDEDDRHAILVGNLQIALK